MKIAKVMVWGLVVVGAIVVGGLAMSAAEWAYRLYGRSRLESLYSIARQVRKGMPRKAVLQLIQKNAAPYLLKHSFPDGDMTS